MRTHAKNPDKSASAIANNVFQEKGGLRMVVRRLGTY
jgi:hypothetical protein